MASSRKWQSNSPLPGSPGGLEAALVAALRPFLRARARLVLGFSGGVDSMVLFDCLRKLAASLDFRFSCVHVNHGISPNARRWAAFCARLCKRHAVPLAVVEVDIGPYRAEGTEAAARRARYQVYARQNADFVVLAHHQDDQAETLLLQLLRGAGVKGGAGMPVVKRQDLRRGTKSPAILRPFLDVSRKQIETYALKAKLKWIEDESNADTHYERNFLRHEVLPVVARSFPAYRATLARAARHLAEANDLLDALAQADAMHVTQPGRLSLAGLKQLGLARTKNLLRWLLQRQGAALPEADRLEEAVRQLFEARKDAAVCVVLGERELRRYDEHVYLLPCLPAPPAGLRRDWDGKRVWPVPVLGGVLRFERRKGEGLSPARVRDEGLNLRVRQGGEKLRLDAKRPTRSLKNLLQEARMPPWERERLPLVYCGEVLACVPGVGVASDYRARSGEQGWFVIWESLR
jgi:tRNA(Ile)-lysidine synthase